VVKEGELVPDFEDEIVLGTCVVRAGKVVHGPTAEALGLRAPAVEAATAPAQGPGEHDSDAPAEAGADNEQGES
jgi:NAD(P) transhydrogenase subunit alpha